MKSSGSAGHLGHRRTHGVAQMINSHGAGGERRYRHPACPPSTSPCPPAPPSRLWRTTARRTPSTPGPRSRSTTRFTANDYTTPLAADGTSTGEMKGRGNYTWTPGEEAIPDQAQRAEPVLGMGRAPRPGPAREPRGRLADAQQARLRPRFRRRPAPTRPASRWVDVRINGDYHGNYLMSEKVEIKKNRVDLPVGAGHTGRARPPRRRQADRLPPRTTTSEAPRRLPPSRSRTRSPTSPTGSCPPLSANTLPGGQT